MGENVLPTGSLIHITSYSPFRGMRGTIRSVDTVSDDPEEPFCFYLIDLEGAWREEPIWFECEDVALVTSPLAALELVKRFV
jgi:hypothetical protein